MTDNSPQLSQPPDQPDPGLGGERGTLHLVEMLSHDDAQVRFNAAQKLTRLGDERAIATFVAIVDNRDEETRLRGRAVEALASFQRPEIEDRLAELMHSDDEPYVVQQASDGLYRLNRDRLRQIGMQLIAHDQSDAFQLRGVDVLRKFRREDDVFETLKHTMRHSAHERVRSQAIEVYRLQGRPELYDTMIDALRDEAAGVRAGAAWTLGVIGDRQAIAAILRLLHDEDNQDWHTQSSLVRALAMLGEPSVIEVIVHNIWQRLDDPHSVNINLLIHSVVGAGELGDRSAVQALIALLDSMTDSDDIVFVVQALERLGDQRAVEPLIQLLDRLAQRDDDASYTIEKVLNALRLLAGPAAVPHLQRFVAGSALQGLEERSRTTMQAHMAGLLLAVGQVEYVPLLIESLVKLGWGFYEWRPGRELEDLQRYMQDADAELILPALEGFMHNPDLDGDTRECVLDVAGALDPDHSLAYIERWMNRFPEIGGYGVGLLLDGIKTKAAVEIAQAWSPPDEEA
ncbi:MAG: HEAT repeat domain-containing protein [Chloroflexi bacterium]|nr:HEAT repeat domain-containing protein [Chloroflexota bacterium]